LYRRGTPKAQPSAATGVGVFEHLLVTDRITECKKGLSSDHNVHAFRFSRMIVNQQ